MLVVSRFNEDLEWVEDFDKFQIYNKGKDDLDLGSIHLGNFGREAHTYLHHIITHYHNLDDIMIFSQGKYEDHFPNFKDLIYNRLGFSIDTAKPNSFNGISVSNRGDFSFRDCFCDEGRKYSLEEWWEQTTGEKYIQSEYVFFNSCFSVSREFILKRSLESYIKIYLTLCDSINPIEGHFCERAWFNIFNLPLNCISVITQHKDFKL
ncbi:MAG: DUF3431 domain-containing protein [Neisseriaceae bacterium]|nr:MAG: DUF3431 domain-containing protein [Neisseriaceae bacterium]